MPYISHPRKYSHRLSDSGIHRNNSRRYIDTRVFLPPVCNAFIIWRLWGNVNRSLNHGIILKIKGAFEKMIKVPLPRFVALLVILAIFFGLLNALITPFISHAGQQIGSPDSLTPRISSLENSSESVGDEWPMYRGALDHAGIGATTPLLGAAPLWVFTTDTAVITAPTVANGRVYAGSLNGSIYCINETTGTIEWTCNYQYVEWNIHPIFSTAAIACGCVYVGGYCQIYCLNATTGEYVWGYGPGIPGISIDSSPAVADGRIYVGSCGNVTCLNATTGALEWNYTTGDTVYSSPAIANGWVYVGSDDDNVYCLNATTGALKWNYTTGDNVYSSPAVANG